MLNKQGKIAVPRGVLDGLETVRASGRINMFDARGVTVLARAMGHPDAAEWVENHRAEYVTGVFRGFEAEEETNQS